MEQYGDRVRKVLVVRMSAIGDVILTLPVVDAIHESFPSAQIDYVVKQEYAELIAHHPGVSKIWSFERGEGGAGLRNLAREIRAQRYDLLIDLHYNLRSAYLRWFGGAGMTRSYRKRILARMAFKSLRWNLLKNAPPVADRYFTALEDFGISRNGRRPRLHLTAPARARAAERLLESGIGKEEIFLAAAPGASFATKRWPAAKFGEAAAAIVGSSGQVVLLGGRSDREVAAEVAAELHRRGVNSADLSGVLEIAESAAVIARAAGLLTNDSGLMHVADALDRPLVAVFGPTSRELGFYPLGEKSRVVALDDLDCRPCTLHGDQTCPARHHRCMEDLAAERVAAAAKEVGIVERGWPT